MKTFTTMRWLVTGILAASLAGCVTVDRTPARTTSVIGGPELVFARPVAEILPQLEGASPAGANGRVGNELVFWGYRLRDNTQASLFACLPREDINCDARIARVCPNGGQELARRTEPGLVRYLNCQTVGVVRPGDLYPGCVDNDRNDPLLVGLIQCR